MKTRRLLKAVGLLISVAIAAELSAGPQHALAAAKIYWGNRITTIGASRIQRANADGSGVEDLITGLDVPWGLALDAGGCRMYWTESNGLQLNSGEVNRAKLDGAGGETLVAGLPLQLYPRGIALDPSGGLMYWTNSGDPGKIQRAQLNGIGLEDLVTGLPYPDGIALDVTGGKLYWTGCCKFDNPPPGNDKIQRANLDGSDAEVLVAHTNPGGIALDVGAGKMYWTQPTFGKISRANLDGSAVEDLVTGLLAPIDIALDVAGGTMYWGDGGSKIQRASLDGSGVADVVTGVSPSGLAFLPPLRLAGCLLLDLKGLVDSCEPCRLGPKKTLLETIDEAIRQVDKEHVVPALNAVQLFVQLTERFVRTGQLPPSEERRFVTLAEDIVSELSTDIRAKN